MIYNNLHQKILEKIFYNIPDSIIVIDKNKYIIYANNRAASSFQTDINDFIGSNFNYYSDNYKNLFGIRIIDEVIASKKEISTLFNVKYGYTSFSTAKPILDEKGNIKYIILNSRSSIVLSNFSNMIRKIKDDTIKSVSIINYINSQSNNDSFNIICKSKEMKKILNSCIDIAKTDSIISLTGESGTGKEVIAKYIHNNSKRKGEVFVPINCSAIPSELMEAEFFGYTKGSFTGANPNGSIGIFEMANNGTVFLDEIGDLPLSMQSKLLRVLETGEVKLIGSNNPIKVDIRVITATNKNLSDLVNNNLFREDLYYRLNVIPIHLPPLRNRKEDIMPLAEYFMSIYNKKYNKKAYLSHSSKEYIVKYKWPGNVRELRNLIERMVVISEDDNIEISDYLDFSHYEESPPDDVNETDNKFYYDGSYKEVMMKFEKDYIKSVMKECNNKVAEAAERMGIHKSVLYKKIKTYNL